MKHYVGIDVGGSRLKAGLVDPKMRVVNEAVAWLEPKDRTEDGLVARLAALVKEVRKGVDPVLVGVGIPGVVDRTRGMVARSPNFPTWRDFPIQRRLTEATRQHVIIDNDANCVVIGEALAGAAAGYRNVIGVTLGTGVGGGIMLDGALWRGVNGMAGELGHIVADPTGPACGCGGKGCLEMYPSVNGLRELCKADPVVGIDPSAQDLPELLARAARAGDAIAIRHFESAGRALGRVLGGLLNVFDVKTVLLAGGVSATWDLLEQATWAAIRGASFPEIAQGVQVLIGKLGEQAGIIGAALQWKAQPGHD